MPEGQSAQSGQRSDNRCMHRSYVETVKPPPASIRAKNLPSLATMVASRALDMPVARQYVSAAAIRDALRSIAAWCGINTAPSTVIFPLAVLVIMREKARA